MTVPPCRLVIVLVVASEREWRVLSYKLNPNYSIHSTIVDSIAPRLLIGLVFWTEVVVVAVG